MSLNQELPISDYTNQNLTQLTTDNLVDQDQQVNSINTNLQLRPKQKIIHKSQFSKIFSASNQFKYGNRFFQILAIKNDLDHPRMGVIASKKQLKRANERNRAKRLVREQFRLQQHQFLNIDFIVMPRKAFEQTENLELVNQLTKAFTIMNKYFSTAKD